MANEEGSSKVMSQFIDMLTELIGNYASHQIECGAQVIQIFES